MSKSTRLSEIPFASVERVPIEIIHRQAAACATAELPATLLGSVLNYVFIINQQGQIVFVSENIRSLVADKSAEKLIGLRLGEALACVHARKAPGGCGTSKPCQECGAVQAIVRSLAGHGAFREFHITRIINCQKQALNLVAMATPLVRGPETFSLFAVTQSSDTQARLALRRLFRTIRR